MNSCERLVSVHKPYSRLTNKWPLTLARARAMMHDKMEYSEPDKFYPARFVPEDGGTVPRDPTTLVFGFGRR
jgi:hypothetical protein